VPRPSAAAKAGLVVRSIFIRPPPPKVKAKAKSKVAKAPVPGGSSRQLVLTFKQYCFNAGQQGFAQ
jgi:hypothetical protein